MVALLISYSSELIKGESVFVSSNCSPVKALNYEPAGHSFHSAALKLSGFCDEEDAQMDGQSISSDDRSQGSAPSSEAYSSKGKITSSAESSQQDHYALLGLGHLRFLATEEQIRKSYRDAALKNHPDKQAALLLAEVTEEAKQAKKDEIENHFKSIHEAYEVLIDPAKRRIYDSIDEFDDEIPSDCAPKNFFKVFGPAFMRNGRWSSNQPVPSLGEEDSPLPEVDSFYNFWYSFKSWREFPHVDEFDLEEAESRDHKRWMERQNTKLREKARKEEHARVRALVDNAYRRDPRILRMKEEEKAEKKRRKEMKFLAKRLQEEEARRIAEEERCLKEEEDRKAAEDALNQKKLKEKEKKLLRKERARLRTLFASVVPKKEHGLSSDDIETICMSFATERLRLLGDNVEGKEDVEKALILKKALGGDSSFEMEQDEKCLQLNGSVVSDPKANGCLQSNGCLVSGPKVNGFLSQVEKDNLLTSNKMKERPWDEEEIEMLKKGIQKYPKGTSRRWEVISEYIGTGRSVDEILKATKTVLLQKPHSDKAFDSFLDKRKPGQSITSPLTTRAESEGLPVGVEAAAKMPPQQYLANGKCNSVTVPNRALSATVLDLLSDIQERALIEVRKKFPEEETAAKMPPQQYVANGKCNSVTVPNRTLSATEQDLWSDIQERALFQALKTFPKEANQRWKRIAARVPGKTVNQCKMKFTSMKDSFRSKKGAD